MDAEFILVSIDTKNSMKQQELAEESRFFQRVLKMGNFGQNAKGGTPCKILEFGYFFLDTLQNSLIIANTSRIAKFSNNSKY